MTLYFSEPEDEMRQQERRAQIVDRCPNTPMLFPTVVRATNVMLVVPFHINEDWAGEIAIMNDSHAYHAAHRSLNILVEHRSSLQDLIIEIQSRYGTLDLSGNLINLTR